MLIARCLQGLSGVTMPTIEIHSDCCCGLSLSDRFEICDLSDTASDLSLTDRLFNDTVSAL